MPGEIFTIQYNIIYTIKLLNGKNLLIVKTLYSIFKILVLIENEFSNPIAPPSHQQQHQEDDAQKYFI